MSKQFFNKFIIKNKIILIKTHFLFKQMEQLPLKQYRIDYPTRAFLYNLVHPMFFSMNYESSIFHLHLNHIQRIQHHDRDCMRSKMAHYIDHQSKVEKTSLKHQQQRLLDHIVQPLQQDSLHRLRECSHVMILNQQESIGKIGRFSQQLYKYSQIQGRIVAFAF